jgi:hypothetical protein
MPVLQFAHEEFAIAVSRRLVCRVSSDIPNSTLARLFVGSRF